MISAPSSKPPDRIVCALPGRLEYRPVARERRRHWLDEVTGPRPAERAPRGAPGHATARTAKAVTGLAGQPARTSEQRTLLKHQWGCLRCHSRSNGPRQAPEAQTDASAPAGGRYPKTWLAVHAASAVCCGRRWPHRCFRKARHACSPPGTGLTSSTHSAVNLLCSFVGCRLCAAQGAAEAQPACCAAYNRAAVRHKERE